MKRVFSAILIMVLLIGTVACSPTDAKKTSVEKTPQKTEAAEETTVKSEDDKKTASDEKPEASEKTGSDKGVVLAMTAPWDSYIPFNTTSNYSDTAIDLIYDRLIFMHSDGSFSPRLADSWERNDDYTEIIFHINKNAKWHDGVPVTADDVVFTANVYSHPDISVARRSMMNLVAGTDDSGMQAKEGDIQVEALDEHTVKFKLKKPAPTDFLLSLRFREVFIIPQHIFGDKPISEILKDEAWMKPIGSGPYKYVSEISGERVELAANEDYYLGKPQFDKLVLRVVDASNLLSGLMNGEIDMVAGGESIPLDDWETAKAQDNLVTQSVKQHGYQYMTINTQKPYLTQKVRQAIDLAIDRQRIVDQLLKGEGVVAAGPISDLSPYFNEQLLPVVVDKEKAKQILEEEKFPFDTTLLMSVPKGNLIRERSAVLIQQDLEEIGIKTEIRVVDFPTHMEVLRNGEYDLGLIGSGGPVDPSQSVLDVTPGHINNFSQNEDPSLGEKGALGQTKLTFEERKAVYDEYQLMMKEQAPFLFLYYPNILIAYNNKIENVKAEDFALRNMNIWEWTIQK